MDAHGGRVVCTRPRTAVGGNLGVNLGVHLGVIGGRVGPTRTHGGRRGGLGTQADRCRGRVRFAEMVYGRSGPMSYGLTVHSSVVKVVGVRSVACRSRRVSCGQAYSYRCIGQLDRCILRCILGVSGSERRRGGTRYSVLRCGTARSRPAVRGCRGGCRSGSSGRGSRTHISVDV